MNKKIRQEILTASDEQIEDAVKYADPMVLRGLLYQLTGDEEVAGTPVANFWAGFVELQIVSDPAAIALLQTRAAAFLKGYRDAGAGDIDYGPPERLRKSIGLTAGEEIPEDEFEMWFEQLSLDPWSRSMHWKNAPPAKLDQFTVCVIGAGMGGLNAAVHLKRAGISFFVVEKNGGVGGTWYETDTPVHVLTLPAGHTRILTGWISACLTHFVPRPSI